MKLKGLGSVGFAGLFVLACSSGGFDADGNVEASSESIVGPSTLGGRKRS